MNIALIALSRPLLSSPLHPSLSHPSPAIVWPLLPPVLISAPIASHPPNPPSPQKLEEVTNLQERVETIGEGGVYLSNSQRHGVENRDMGMREGFGDNRGWWDGGSGWRGGGRWE